MAADSSTTAQRRRATKPLIEKRRRARINSSLARLKEMVASKSNVSVQESRSNRLEKADILELTVEYVRSVHRGKSIGDNTVDGSDLNRSFKEGYRLCMTEVQKFFSNNYRQQAASKQFTHRSLQSYLEKTLRDTVAKPLCIGADLEEPSPTRCRCQSTRLVDAVPSSMGNDDCEFHHSENSDFSHSYSSALTDDEMTEHYSVSRAESNAPAKSFNLLQSKRASSHPNGPAQDKMWRPW